TAEGSRTRLDHEQTETRIVCRQHRRLVGGGNQACPFGLVERGEGSTEGLCASFEQVAAACIYQRADFLAGLQRALIALGPVNSTVNAGKYQNLECPMRRR